MVVRGEANGNGPGFTGYVILKAPAEAVELLEYCQNRMEDTTVLLAVEIRIELPYTWKTLATRAAAAYPRWGEV